MNKRIRQYIGLFSAVFAYYCIHEGAHLVFALLTGAFRQINFMGLGVQIDIYTERLTDAQLGLFCLAGAAATAAAGYGLTFAAKRICQIRFKAFKACMYYITIAMLLIDPLYLSLLCGFFGGGDMNGIALLLPEPIARALFGALMICNALLFFRYILPRYTRSFAE